MTTTTNNSSHGFVDDAAPTTDRARHLAHEAVDQAAATAGSFEKDLRRSAHNAGEKLSASKSAIDETVENNMDRVATFARERPAAAAGIAFAAGVLATTLLRRK